jgi:uncharacterized heparinase superfamily protein
LARATAAHSTATINDTSSARFSHSLRVGDLVGAPLTGGPRHVPCKRLDESGRQGFVARHDGYAQRFGILHERELVLSAGGNLLTGRDRFRPAGGGPIRNSGRDHVSVRFHLHPDVSLFRNHQGHLVLTADGADTWRFSADVEPQVEESIYFAGLAGPRRTRQIVLAFKASEIAEVHWQLARE